MSGRGRWWDTFLIIRTVTIFILGVLVIIDALFLGQPDGNIPMLVVGMVMIGVLPIENLFVWHIARKDSKSGEESMGSKAGR